MLATSAVQGWQCDHEYGYIVMELGDFNLADFLMWHTEAQGTWETLLGVAEQLLRGLQHMHESCHITHGNLKVRATTSRMVTSR